MKLSLCMIVKNEEAVLKRCLESVDGLFDEIIIVDTGSSDKTKDIAKQFTSKIYNFKWVDDFSRARNFSFSKATGDYIMWLDADDVVTAQNLEKLNQIKQKLNGSVDCYMLKYALTFNAQNQPTFIYYRERIVKNNNTFFWNDPVHEVITPHGKIEYSDAEIHHKKVNPTPTDRNLKIYQNILKNNTPLTARQKFYYSRELYYNGLYKDAIESFEEYLNFYDGWLENKIEACLMTSYAYRNLKDFKNALNILFLSFCHDTPRAEILCEIGSLFMLQKQYKNAIFWLKQATRLKINLTSGAFVLPQTYNFIPYLQLCVCYYNTGHIKLAEKYNLKAEKIDPNNLSVIINKQLFAKLKQNKK